MHTEKQQENPACAKPQPCPSPSPAGVGMLWLPSALRSWLPGAISLGGAGAPRVTFGISALCLPSVPSPRSLRSSWARPVGTGEEEGAAPSPVSQSLPSPHSPWAVGVPHLSLPQPQYPSPGNQNHPSCGFLTIPHTSPSRLLAF